MIERMPPQYDAVLRTAMAWTKNAELRQALAVGRVQGRISAVVYDALAADLRSADRRVKAMFQSLDRNVFLGR
jgi:hypothetical protein